MNAAVDARTSYRAQREREEREKRDSPLGVALAAAVPLWIAQLEQLDDEAFAELWRQERLDEVATLVGEHGDDLLFRSKKPGATAAIFNRVAEAIALLSFCPSGIEIFGQRWTASRPVGSVPATSWGAWRCCVGCHRVRLQRRCPSCGNTDAE